MEAVLPRSTTDDARRMRLLQVSGLGVSAVALLLVLGSLDTGAAMGLIAQARLPLIGMCLALLVVQLLVRATRWQILLPRRADGQRVSLRVTTPALLAGYLGNALLPLRLGEPLRAALVARQERLDALECFGATVVERVVDTSTLAVVVFLAALALGTPMAILALTACAALAGVVVLGLLVTVGLSRVAVGLSSRLHAWLRSPRMDGLCERAVAFAQGVDRGRSPRRLLAVIALSCCCWALDAFVFWLVAQAIDVPLSLAAAVLIAGVTVLATAVPAAPGYIGTYELAATTTAAVVGVPGAEALAVTVLAHVLTTVPLALGGALALGISGARWPRRAGGARWTEVPAPMSSPRVDVVGQR